MSKCLLGSVFALLCGVLSSVSAQESYDALFSDVVEYWTPTPIVMESDKSADFDETFTSDDGVTPAQMLGPQAQRAPRMSRLPRRSAVARRNPNLASVPFMIGDTGAGTCLSIGGLGGFTIEHPTLTCSRLNISENNSPLPQDRTYVSYRHFRGATGVEILGDYTRDFNIDRFTLATERTIWDGMASLELRLPLERRLTSDFSSTIDLLFDPTVEEPFEGGRQNELGNVSAIFKALLMERSDWALSCGLGATIPTSRDFNYSYFLNTAGFLEIDPMLPPVLLRQLERFEIKIENEIVYLSPFLSWAWKPHEKFFHQGFLQVEVAANPSTAFVRGSGQLDTVDLTDPMNPVFDTAVTASSPNPGLTTEIHAQTLMRLNLGCGYILKEDPNARCLKRLASLFEIHYTTTLQDAKLSTIPLIVDPPVAAVLLDPTFRFGNFSNRNDIVNVTTGVSANLGQEGRTIVTNGLTLPVSSGEERAFDLEYNLQIQRLF